TTSASFTTATTGRHTHTHHRATLSFFFFQAEDGIRDGHVTGVQTCALPIYTHTNTWTEFVPPTYPNQTRRLNVDYQNNIWWGEWSGGTKQPGKLAKLDQTTGRITEYTIPEQAANPYDVSMDLEGNIWFPDSPTADRSAMIGKFNPKDQTFTFYPKPQFAADTPKIQLTKDGAVWFAPRGSRDAPAISVLYPDMDKITTFGAFYVNGP